MEPHTILNNNHITSEELKSLLNNPSDQFNWLIKFDSEGEKIFYSDNFLFITGYAPDELRTPHFKNNLIVMQEYYSTSFLTLILQMI